MTQAKHTPGPWKHLVRVRKSTWQGDKTTVSIYAAKRLVADFDASYVEYPESNEEIRCNARLIAAAPELLEVLRKISFLLSATNEDPGEPSFMPEVRAAIAKAEGQS